MTHFLSFINVFNPQKLNVLFLLNEASSNTVGGEFLLVSLLIWLIGLFIVRWRISKFILIMMNKTSNKITRDQPEELKKTEFKAKNKPIFEDLSKHIDGSLAIEKREQFVKRAFVLFRKKFFYGLLTFLMYFLLPFGINSLTGNSFSDDDEMYIMTMGFPIMYLLFICFNYYFYRKQFRAQDASFGIRIEHPYIMVLRKIVNPTFEAYFSFFIIIYMTIFGLTNIFNSDFLSLFNKATFNKWFGIGLILASLFHLFIYFLIRKIAKKEPNQALLILRVFGDKKQTQLTFGKITNFWKHFGSWFTVADPSFIKRQNSFFTFKTISVLLTLFTIAGYLVIIPFGFFSSKISQLTNLSEDRILEILFVPAITIAWFFYYRYLKFKISRGYASDLDEIKKRLKKTLKKQRNLDLSFKSLPMFCYDNTWKLAVSEFIKNSKVVLMDLRGFSDKRKGCEYEIDFLLDTFPITQILFLADVTNDLKFIEQTILERWEYLREHSPNIQLKNPITRIYLSDNQDKMDVQSIIDLLIVSVDDSKN